jgi:cytochrome c
MPRQSRNLNLSAAAVRAGVAAIVLTAPAWAADANHGQKLYVACAACHTDRPDALGPSLRGVVGRHAAAVAGFRYSNAMRRANFTWTEDNLRAYIADPQAKVKGNRMPFGGLHDAHDIDDVVAYLATLK